MKDELKANIFNIQKLSAQDGPGIRTTVFFKGCNLRCRWCHNPESQNFGKELMLYPKKCKSCGLCERVCTFSLKSCNLCGRCARYCPTSAREMVGREMTVDELMREICMDRMFYDTSGGGVTFSGGECMLQPDVLTELLVRCHAQGIHTAVDTAGDVPWSTFERVIPHTDLFLYDLKCISSERHRMGTSVPNERILENLVRLSKESDCHITVRIPLIVGFNVIDEEIEQMAEFLRPLRIDGVELLPYHSMGNHKYEALGRTAIAYAAPSKRELKRFEKLFRR